MRKAEQSREQRELRDVFGTAAGKRRRVFLAGQCGLGKHGRQSSGAAAGRLRWWVTAGFPFVLGQFVPFFEASAGSAERLSAVAAIRT